MSQANLKGVSGVLFIGVSRKFKGGFKENLIVFNSVSKKVQ